MTTGGRRRWADASPRLRAVAGLTACVLAANVVIVAGGFTNERVEGVAPAAVALASTYEAPVVPWYTVEIPGADLAVDPNAVLPVPERPPANAYAPTPEVRHGQLEIPKIGLSQPFFEGVTLTAINRGPSHWPGTAMPGEIGNVVIAGHRTTYTRPFWALNELVPGDELIFTMNDGERFVYELVEIEIVSPTDIHIIDQTHGRTATLFGCHPRGSARQRIVGHFRQKADPVTVEVPHVQGLPLPAA